MLNWTHETSGESGERDGPPSTFDWVERVGVNEQHAFRRFLP